MNILLAVCNILLYNIRSYRTQKRQNSNEMAVGIFQIAGTRFNWIRILRTGWEFLNKPTFQFIQEMVQIEVSTGFQILDSKLQSSTGCEWKIIILNPNLTWKAIKFPISFNKRTTVPRFVNIYSYNCFIFLPDSAKQLNSSHKRQAGTSNEVFYPMDWGLFTCD